MEMSRTIKVAYDERGYKVGKMKFYVDGMLYLSLANHESGVIDLSDTNAHVITAKIWGIFPIYRWNLEAGNDSWTLCFVQEDAAKMGKFIHQRVHE